MLLILAALMGSVVAQENHAFAKDSFAAQGNCEDPTWVSEPAIKNNRLHATITSTCELAPAAQGSIALLQENITTQIGSDYKVSSGPTPETYLDLPSSSYQAVQETSQNGNKITLTLNMHLATDQKTVLVFDQLSTEVKGSGDSAFLKVLNTQRKIEKNGDANTFKLTIVQTVEIEKPWYAPGGTFISEGSKRVKAGFVDTANLFATEITDELVAN